MGFTPPTSPITYLTVDGTTYSLAFDFEAVAQAEELTGRSILTGLTSQTVSAPSINFVRAMLFACLLKHQAKMTYDEAKALVKRDNLSTIWQAVVDCYVSDCVDQTSSEAAQADPTPDQG
ncbi:MAG TPA: hypothetical protein VGS10_11485 [Terracidiphilus sp.]|nr:hypothetical protein [Terracidiphilus sp.]